MVSEVNVSEGRTDSVHLFHLRSIGQKLCGMEFFSGVKAGPLQLFRREHNNC